MPEGEKIRTYVVNFDKALGGGIPRQHAVLIKGAAGTMKSSLAFYILYHNVMQGMSGIYITLEQSTLSILKHIVSMDLDLTKVNLEIMTDAKNILEGIDKLKPAEKKLIIIDFGSLRKEINKMNTKSFSYENWVDLIVNITKKLNQKKLCDILVLDSLTALMSLSSTVPTREEKFYTIEKIRDINLSLVLMINEKNPRVTIGPGEEEIGDIESFLSDGIITLELTKRYRLVTREISIDKMRATNCDINVFTLKFDNGRFSTEFGGKTPLL